MGTCPKTVQTAILSCLLTLGGFTPLTAGAAEVYRWVDEEGVVNFTQQKPRDVASQQLLTRAGSPTVVRDDARPAAPPPAAEPGSAREMNDSQEAMLEDLRAAEQARQAEVAKIRAANCEQSRKVLANLSAKERVRVRDGDGTERVMGEEERQRRIGEAQQGIVENCSAA